MADSLQTHDLLVRYLDGELSIEEKTSLEERLRSDEALRSELQNLKIAVLAMRQYGTTQQVGTIHQQMMKEMNVQKRSSVFSIRKSVRYTLAVAASALILFIGIRLFLNAGPSPEKLYKEAFVDFHLSATRGNEALSSDIEKLYQQKNYASVTTTSRSRMLSAKDSLLIGLSYLHTNRPDQAISFFEQLASSNNDFQQDATFYLSLGYLKTKNYEKAASIMKSIASDPAHLYHQQISVGLIEDVEALQNK